MRKGFVPALVVAACLAIAACGGSGSSSTVRVVKPSPVTNRSFDASLGALCTKANAAFGATNSHKVQVSVISHYLTVFRAVKVPSALQSIYNQYLGVLSQELAALRRGDSNELFTLAHDKARPLAKKLGATGCIT